MKKEKIMSKLIISILLLAVFVLGAVLLIKDDPGFVLIQYAGQSLETSLAVAIVALVFASLAINVTFKVLIFALRIGKHLKKRADKRRMEKSRVLLNKGLIDLTEGRFSQAKTKLTQLIDYAENPLINYLTAARAAHQLGEYDQRDSYLKQAYETNPDAQIAIGVTQGELQLAAKQTERAYATLTDLHQKSPKHGYVLKLLAKVYIALEEWEKLKELLPTLKKKKLFVASKLNEIEQLTYSGCLDGPCTENLDQLKKLYQHIKKALPNDSILLIKYINRLEQLDDSQVSLEKALRESLDLHWNKNLILRYGLLDQIKAKVLLTHSEKWQDLHGFDADLLLTLGRLSRREQLWGKAQSYLEASIAAGSNAHNCLELAELLEIELKQPEKAMSYYQKGLRTCAGKSIV